MIEKPPIVNVPDSFMADYLTAEAILQRDDTYQKMLKQFVGWLRKHQVFQGKYLIPDSDFQELEKLAGGQK